MKRALFFLLALSVFYVACNKTPDPQVDVTSMLRTGKWHISSGTVTIRGLDGTKVAQKYYPDLRRLCLRDDYITFDSSNRGFVFSNSSRCSNGDIDSVAFVWQLKNNDSLIDLFNVYHMVDSVAVSYIPVAGTSAPYMLKFDTATTAISNIRNAKLSNVTDNSFSLQYSLVARSFDSTGGHFNGPLVVPDTFVFNVTYTH